MQKSLACLGLGLMLALAVSLKNPASGVVGGEGGDGTVTSTTSTTHHTTVTDLPPITLATRGYSTQVLGILMRPWFLM